MSSRTERSRSPPPKVKAWGTDECSTEYDKMTSSHPQHEFCYQYTAFKSMGDLTGKRVVDIPSGEGKYTVRLLRGGAAYVKSVDIAPKMIELTRERVEAAGYQSRWSGVVGNATERLELGDGEYDVVLANYLFEYCEKIADLTAMAENVFRATAPGGRIFVMYVPGTQTAEDNAHVMATVGIDVTLLTPDIVPGTKCQIRYHRTGSFCYEVFYWPVEMVAQALRDAGFEDVTIKRIETDPSYTGEIDLARFAAHTANKHLTGRKPLPASS